MIVGRRLAGHSSSEHLCQPRDAGATHSKAGEVAATCRVPSRRRSRIVLAAGTSVSITIRLNPTPIPATTHEVPDHADGGEQGRQTG